MAAPCISSAQLRHGNQFPAEIYVTLIQCVRKRFKIFRFEGINNAALILLMVWHVVPNGNFFWKTPVFFVGAIIPRFGLLLTSALGFEARVDPSLVYLVTCVQWISQIHLWCETCWPLGGDYVTKIRMTSDSLKIKRKFSLGIKTFAVTTEGICFTTWWISKLQMFHLNSKIKLRLNKFDFYEKLQSNRFQDLAINCAWFKDSFQVF